KEHLVNMEPFINISLGPANFIASISDVLIVRQELIEERSSHDLIYLHSAVPSNQVIELKFDKEEYDNYNFVEEDMMPGDFVGNNNREVRTMNRLLFSITPNPLCVNLKCPFYTIQLGNEVINIQFLDI